jgi:hypothetical protein
LARILYTLLEEAGLHRWEPQQHTRPLAEQYQRLRQTQRYLVNGIPLRRYLWTYPGAIEDALQQLATEAQQVSQQQLQQSTSNWPLNVKPQGFLVAIASGANATQRLLQFPIAPTEVEVEQTFAQYSLPHSQVSAPFWAIACLSESLAHPGRYGVTSVYIHPVYSRRVLVPVDSHFERITLRLLLDLQERLFAEGVSFTIEKPLHDIQQEAGRCRPDFLLSLQSGARVVVETMGFETEEYRQRKQRTHESMQALGPVVEFWAGHPLTPQTRLNFQTNVTAALDIRL